MLSAEGLEVARSIENGKALAFVRKAMIIRDGTEGKKGGLALLRLGEGADQSSVLFKFSSQGMGHGHFDRLGIALYDKGREILPDYGAARFLNVTAKEGGRYLPENTSWAKQTVAHNTVVLNAQSHFNSKLNKAEANNPSLLFADLENEQIQIVSASDSNCYKNTVLNRTLAFLEIEGRRYLIDLFNIKNTEQYTIDLPVYFNGQILDFNFPYTRLKEYKTLGNNNGYQHLLIDAFAKDLPPTSTVSWMNGEGFYTLASLAKPGAEFYITRLGAKDPNYNLREQSGFMKRQNGSGNIKELNVYEIHGNYNPVSEAVSHSEGSIAQLQLIEGDKERILIQIALKDTKQINLLLDLGFTNSKTNELILNGESYQWEGNYRLLIN